MGDCRQHPSFLFIYMTIFLTKLQEYTRPIVLTYARTYVYLDIREEAILWPFSPNIGFKHERKKPVLLPARCAAGVGCQQQQSGEIKAAAFLDAQPRVELFIACALLRLENDENLRKRNKKAASSSSIPRSLFLLCFVFP